MLEFHSSIPVRREVGRQAGYCSLRELFLSIYSIRRSMTKMFMYYDNFVSAPNTKTLMNYDVSHECSMTISSSPVGQNFVQVYVFVRKH